jgi:2'-5' RNA ligase
MVGAISRSPQSPRHPGNNETRPLFCDDRVVPRLFVAIDLPPGVQEALAGLSFGLPGAKWVPAGQIHLTLAFIGDVDGGLAADVADALGQVQAAEFELSLRGLGHFPPRGEPRVAWAGVRPSEPLMNLQRSISRVLEKAGCELEKRKFHPHVTLARLKDTPSRRLADWLAGNGLFETAPFTVTEFLLFSSTLGSSGAVHAVESAHPLRGADEKPVIDPLSSGS